MKIKLRTGTCGVGTHMLGSALRRSSNKHLTLCASSCSDKNLARNMRSIR